TLCLKRKRASSGKGIVERRQLVTVEELLGARMVHVLSACPAPALPDFCPCRFEHTLVVSVLPLHQLFNDVKQPLAFFLLSLFGGKQISASGGIIHHLGKDHGPRRGQRPPCPPKMQRARMTVAD